MSDWLSIILRVSSPLYFLILVPFFLIFLWKNLPRTKIPIPYLSRFKELGLIRESHLSKIKYFVWWGLVIALVLTLVSPAIPTLKTIVVQERQECDRDIVYVVDISGSMKGPFGNKEGKTKFDAARESLYSFAKGRAGDCFTTVIFSGSGSSSYPPNEQGYALIVNYSVENPDALILPIKEGIDDKKPASQLRQLSQGTRISEGLILGRDFLFNESSAKSKAAFVVTDLGNESGDDKKVIDTINELLERDIPVYIFGIEVDKRWELYGALQPLIEDGRIYYFDIRGEDDFSGAYALIDALEPAPAPQIKTEIVSVYRINFLFLWAAMALWILLMLVEYRGNRLP